MKTSVGYAFDYIMGLALFGLVWGLLNLMFSQLTAMKTAGDLPLLIQCGENAFFTIGPAS